MTEQAAEVPTCGAPHPKYRHRWCNLPKGHAEGHGSRFVDRDGLATWTFWEERPPKLTRMCRPLRPPRWVVWGKRAGRAHLEDRYLEGVTACGLPLLLPTRKAEEDDPSCKNCLRSEESRMELEEKRRHA